MKIEDLRTLCIEDKIKWSLHAVNFHIISDWINHNKSDEKERNNAKIMAC